MDNNHSISNFSESGILRRYVDILSEAGFKAVLCNKRNRDVLIDILNIALPPHKHVRSIAYSSTEIPGFTFANKSVRLDLRCTGDDGTEFIVELQCYRQDNFFRRCVEYAAKVYDAGSVRGDRHKYGLPPVYFIALLAGDAVSADRSDPVWKDRFIAEYTFREKLTGEVPDDTISIIFGYRHIYGCASAMQKPRPYCDLPHIPRTLALLSASAYICRTLPFHKGTGPM